MPDMIFEENKVKETYFDKYEGINSENISSDKI